MPDGTMTQAEAAAYAVREGYKYVPRKFHVPFATMHKLMGMASHRAWIEMFRAYGTPRMKGKGAELRRKAGDLARKWAADIIRAQLPTV